MNSGECRDVGIKDYLESYGYEVEEVEEVDKIAIMKTNTPI